MLLRKLVGKNIRIIRNEKGLSQEALAVKAHLHKNYISLVERGGANISIDSLEKVARVLKIDSSRLLSEKSSK